MVELCDASFQIKNRAGKLLTWHDNDEKPTSRDSELRAVRREDLDAACADLSPTGFVDFVVFVQDLWRLRPGGVELDVAQVISNWRWRYLQARGGGERTKTAGWPLCFPPPAPRRSSSHRHRRAPARRWSLPGATTC